MSFDTVALSVESVSKRYELYQKPRDRLLQMIYRGKKNFFTEFWALNDISFSLGKGKSIGILGQNGAGKSTLLQIIAGVLKPTMGDVRTRGRIAALLELGSGFSPDFTGRENAYLNGAILGLSRDEMDAAMPEIERFASIGDFFDRPVKIYSSGMMVRVAFAVQVQVKPDVLIVDEALAVGDALFQKRCYERIQNLLDNGTSLLFVTHDGEAIRRFTQEAILLKNGKMEAFGPSADVLNIYKQQLLTEEKRYLRHSIQSLAEIEKRFVGVTENEKKQDLASDIQFIGIKEFGDKEAEILSTMIYNHEEEEDSVFYSGEPLSIRITFKTHHDMDKLNIGVRIRNKEGVKIYSWGSLNQDMESKESAFCQDSAGRFCFWSEVFKAGQEYTVELKCGALALGEGFYEVESYLAYQPGWNFQGQLILHWVSEAAFFNVHVHYPAHFFGGLCDMNMQMILRE